MSGAWWFDNIPGSILLRRWCDSCDAPVWRWHRHAPSGDLIEHDLDEDCVCGPRIEPVKRDDGSIGWVYIHHALDGRP